MVSRWRRRRRPRGRPRPFALRDLVDEASTSLAARPSRLVITTLGTVLGIASLVVTAGFAQTAEQQIDRQFAAAGPTHLVVTPATIDGADGPEAVGRLPWDASARASQLVGVTASGLVAEVREDLGTITSLVIDDPTRPPGASPVVVAASAGLFDATGAHLQTGRLFDDGHDARADRVAVLGSEAARRLGIGRVDNQPSVVLGGHCYQVIGIVDAVPSRPDLVDAVIVTLGAGRAELGVTAPDQLEVSFAVGTADTVSHQLPIALAPDAPSGLLVQRSVTQETLKTVVQDDVGLVFGILGVLALLAGAVGIANVTQLSVTERTGEIGLRRALGARPRDIRQQFLLEAAITGILGGLVGSALGVLAVVAVCWAKGWTPVVAPLVSVAAVAAGALVGLLAGAWPATRAARVEPVAALREGT